MAGRSEARIFTSIWKDPDFLLLEPGAQRLYMFLLSQEELTYCGTMPLRAARWARKALGMTVDDVEMDLKMLEGTAYPSDNPGQSPARQPFVITDPETGELLIRSLMRRDSAWKQPNLLKQARESAEQIESPRIRGVLLCELRRLPLEDSSSAQVKTLVAEFIADLEEGNPYPSAYPPDNHDPDPSDNPDDNPDDDSRARPRILPTPFSPAPTSLPAQPARDRKQGTRLPEDFALTADMRSWAATEAPHVNAERELERFRDYWLAKAGKDGRKLDWRRTWNNWMRTAEDRQGPRQRSRPDHTEDLFSEAAQRIAGRKEVT